MTLGFSNIIGEIEAELALEYMPGAIKWADETQHLAWSNALDRFDKALIIAIDRKDYALARSEGAFYRATILDLISKYKRHKKVNDTQSFIKSISA